MTIPSSSSQIENCSKHRASFFTGTDYPYWKARMTWYLQSTDLDVWDVIEDGPTLLITTKKCYFVDLIIMVLSTFE